MSLRIELETSLQEFDGVAVSVLSETRAAHRDRPGFVDEIVRLCADQRSSISHGAAWILKAEADDGARFGTRVTGALVEQLENISAWQSQLAICQSVTAFDFDAADAASFCTWASSLANHPRPFLRAWSLHARVILGVRLRHPKAALLNDIEAATQDDAASVRARARNLTPLIEDL